MIQVLGAVILVIGIWLWSPRLSVIVLGTLVFVYGVLREMGGEMSGTREANPARD